MTFNETNSQLYKILNLLKFYFPHLFIQNTIGKLREYSFSGILALMIFSAHNPSSSFRKIIKFIRSNKYILTILNFKNIPHFSIHIKNILKIILIYIFLGLPIL